MPWSKPASRMREYVLVLKAIWACWYEGAALEFRGEFYNHTLMTPMFTPPDGAYGAPPVLVAAVGPLMTEKAAEVADGILLHSFTTAEYIREVNLPAMQAGFARSGRSRADLQVVGEPADISKKLAQRFGDIFDIFSASVFTGDGYSSGEFSPSVADAIKQSSN